MPIDIVQQAGGGTERAIAPTGRLGYRDGRDGVETTHCAAARGPQGIER
jgi:hypothetical protein